MLRFEIREYGWKNGKPYNRIIRQTDYFEEAKMYLKGDTYIVDNEKNMVIEYANVIHICA